MFRLGLATTLANEIDFALAGECGEAVTAMTLAPACEPDVILLGRAGECGLELGAQVLALRTLLPRTRVVLVTEPLSVATRSSCLTAGASGLLGRTASRQDVLTAVTVPGYGLSKRAGSLNPADENFACGADLTDREHELLGLMAQGLSNRYIGLRLGITVPTVKFHVGNIMSKLQASNRTTAVLAALRGRLLDMEALA